MYIQGKKSSRAGRKKAPHFKVVAQKEGYKESREKKKSYGAKRRIQGCYTSVLRRNGDVFSRKLHNALSVLHLKYVHFIGYEP